MKPELILLYFEPFILIAVFQCGFIKAKAEKFNDIRRKYSNKCLILKFNYNLKFYIPLLILSFIVNLIFNSHVVKFDYHSVPFIF
jgi:hypothetical protein